MITAGGFILTQWMLAFSSKDYHKTRRADRSSGEDAARTARGIHVVAAIVKRGRQRGRCADRSPGCGQVWYDLYRSLRVSLAGTLVE